MPARRIDPAMLRTVHLVPESDVFKAVYFDPERMTLRPNLVFVDASGSVFFETNEVGLKGDPVDPGRKLAVVWGDSVAFSVKRGWPCLLDQFAWGYQFLNGGIDGDPYTNVLRRAREFNRRHRVALNLLMLGWHPFVPERVVRRPSRWSWLTGASESELELRISRAGNENLRRDLTEFLRAVPDTVVLTMPTALNQRNFDQDLSGYLCIGDDDTGFSFLGYVPYQVEGQRQGFEHILERNAITREVCAELRIRVVDLFAILDTENQADFREHFLDVLHLRPRSYRHLAELVYDNIKDLLV